MICSHCGEECGDETVVFKKKWVSHGPVGPYEGLVNGGVVKKPVVMCCHKKCKVYLIDDRARYFAVLDETMNTHADFVRMSGQKGIVNNNDGNLIECFGWQTASEVGVPYKVHDRYKEYF